MRLMSQSSLTARSKGEEMQINNECLIKPIQLSYEQEPLSSVLLPFAMKCLSTVKEIDGWRRKIQAEHSEL